MIEKTMRIGKLTVTYYDRGCKLAPRGWYCNAEAGHDGPCPAYPTRWTRIAHFISRGKTFRSEYGF